MRYLIAIVLAVAVLAASTAAALADSTPIGALPAGPTSSIDVQHGELVAVALPQRSGRRVWRIARTFDARVLSEVSEANARGSVILVFRAKSAGRTTISMALTKSDVTSKALESRVFKIHVR
jgi:molybdopterin biosynthesis enzyme